MITVYIDHLARETFNHCECPQCLSSDNVYCITLVGDVEHKVSRIEEDLLCCTNEGCRHVFDWVTSQTMLEPHRITIMEQD